MANFKRWQVGCPCCQSETCGCFSPCGNGSNCEMPNQDLSLRLNGFKTVNGATILDPVTVSDFSLTIPLTYYGDRWLSDCLSDQVSPIFSGYTCTLQHTPALKFQLLCQGTNLITSDPIIGLSLLQYCGNGGPQAVCLPGNNIIGSTAVYTMSNNGDFFSCSPLNLLFNHFDVLQIQQINTFYNFPTGIITGANGSSAPTGYCVNLCVACTGEISNSHITVASTGTNLLVASGITNSAGCVRLNIGSTATYDIDIDAPGFLPKHFQQQLICPNTYLFNIGCRVILCVNYCGRPNPDGGFPSQFFVPGIDAQFLDPTDGRLIFHTISNSSDCLPGQCIDSPISGVFYDTILTYKGQTIELDNVFCGGVASANVINTRVMGCGGLPIKGATVTFNGNTQITGDDGIIPEGFLAPDSNILPSVTSPRFLPFPEQGLGGACEVTLAPTDNFLCCVTFNPTTGFPVCKTLQLIDSVLGAVTLTFGGGYPGFEVPNGWGGFKLVNFAGKCGCPASDVIVLYTLTCGDTFPFLGVNVLGTQSIQPPCNCGPNFGFCPGGGMTPVPVGNWIMVDYTDYPLDVTYQTALGCPGEQCFQCGDRTCYCANEVNSDIANCFGTVWGVGRTVVTISVTDEC